MRYLLLLLFLPSAAFATCHAGVNYGQYPITAGNPVCAPYSGSSLGGCFAYCGGSNSGAVCVEFPSANPPTKGPYFTNGNECQYNNGGDSNSGGNTGGNPDGIDGTNTNPNGIVDVGSIMVGDKYVSDFGKGFNAVSNNVNKSSEKVQKAVTDLAKQLENDRGSDNAKYYDPMISLLERIATNTSGISSGGGSGPSHEVVGYLKSINEKTVLDPSFWMNEISHDREKAQYYYSNMRDLVSHIDGLIEWGPNNGGSGGSSVLTRKDLDEIKQNLFLSAANSDSLNRMASDSEYQTKFLEGISENVAKIASGDGGGEGGGDKPCTGPLCSFNKPSGSSGSALSSVFGPESIEDIKAQVETKNGEIMQKMDEIKKVFVSEQISISGTYNNDYQDVHGVKVDLSGKSNMELFFNSGPKTAIWFIAVLIAFTILMGGRKNA